MKKKKRGSYLERFYRSGSMMIEKAMMSEHTFMLLVSIVIGVLAGYGAILIRAMIYGFSALSFPGEGNFLENILQTHWYLVLLLPAIGGLIVGPLIHFFAPEAKGTGVPEVMLALFTKGGKIRTRVVAIKALVSSITIGTGGSVGREGPIIQIGAAIGSTVGQFFRISGSRIKTLVGCGAAAGIAAAFNAPIAGVLFAVEIILMDFAVSQFSPIVISSVVATVISHYFQGNFVAFQLPPYQMGSPVELWFYAILGICCGIISSLFIKTIFSIDKIFVRGIKLPAYLKPTVGGLMVGCIALFYPQIMGVGYESINLALHGSMLGKLAFLLIFMKIIATSVTLGGGSSGGIFAPSLFIGAMVGCSFGILIHSHFPDTVSTPGSYALVAMGGLVAGTTRAPITAIIMIFELTNTYDVILPLMITCIISAILSSKFIKESIYTLKLLSKNINVQMKPEINIMKTLYVRDIYSPHYEIINDDMNFKEIINKVFSNDTPYFAVFDKQNKLLGMLSLHNIKKNFFEWNDLGDLVVARDITVFSFPRVIRNSDCEETLNLMIEHRVSGIPVVDAKDETKILGMIWQKDILDAYHKEISRLNLGATLLDRMQWKEKKQEISFMEGYSLSEISMPRKFIGKTIIELDIRAKYGVLVLSIRGKNSGIQMFPTPQYRIKEEDESLTVAGEIDNINILKNLT